MNKTNLKGIKATIDQLSTLVEDISKVLHLKADPKACFNKAIQIYETFIELFQDGGTDVAAAEILKELESFENIELHIAVTGETGAGKSSLINALRGLSAEDDGAAPVGVTETTLEPTPYQNCSYPNIIFWDLPGLGSPGFSLEHYLSKVKFPRYDFFIIVGSERFKSNHIDLVQQILQMNKKCYFVRSKLDSDLDNEQNDHPSTYNKKQVIEKIRHNCSRKLEESFQKSSPPFFLISSWDLGKYDFPVLVQTLQNDLPSLKRLAFLLSLPNFSPEIIARKKADLKKHIWKISLVSACINAIPVPELPILCDMGVLFVSMVAFYKKFELDDKSLARLAKRAKIPVEELNAVIKSPGEAQITRAFVVKRCIDCAHQIISKVDLVTGTLLPAALSFGVTYWMLSSFLDKVVEDAESVNKKITEMEGCEGEISGPRTHDQSGI